MSPHVDNLGLADVRDLHDMFEIEAGGDSRTPRWGLDRLDDDTYVWSYAGSGGVSQDLGEAIVALGRAIREVNGAAAQKTLLLAIAKGMLALDCDCRRKDNSTR